MCRRSGSGNSSSGPGQQISIAPSAVPGPGSGSTARAPCGQSPISGASAASGTALGPPVLGALVRRPLRGGVHVRVDAPPAAGVARREPGLRRRVQCRRRARPARGPPRPRLPGPVPPRGRRPRCRRRRAPPPRRPRPARPGGCRATVRSGASGSADSPVTVAADCCPVICAASSARLVPDSADRCASWACASVGEQRSRSISMPRARSTTARAAAPDCILSSSRRCRAIRALSRANSAPLGTVTVGGLPGRFSGLTATLPGRGCP